MTTAAEVDIEVRNSGFFMEAFRFGVEGDTSWSFSNKNFICEIKANRDDAVALLSCTNGNGRIVVDDVTERILHFFVTDDVIRASLPPADYVYDLVMVDTALSNARTVLMFGKLTVEPGVTLSD